MVLRRHWSGSAAVVSVLFFALALRLPAETREAESCSYDHVSAMIASSSAGDVVKVPPGSATWSSALEITKAITLQGAGAGSTDITGRVKYTMSSPDQAGTFRLTGFSLTWKGTEVDSPALWLKNSSATYVGRVRVDHNAITASGYALRTEGNVFGVVDNNTVTMGSGFYIMGGNALTWSSVAFAYGDDLKLFVEDNSITFTGTLNQLFQDSGAGAIFVLRYNDYAFSCTGGSNVYWWDMHGNQIPGSNHSTMGAEIYGNRLVSTTAGNLQIIDQRGGSALVYWNKAASGIKAAWYKTREECDDCLNSHSPCSGPAGQPMHVSDSYYWNNRYGTTLITTHFVANDTTHACALPTHEVALGVDVFRDDGNGVGCGNLSSRPATCTVGEAYWATDQTCSSVEDESTGRNPMAPVSGVLYKCTAPNTWTLYYTPYEYPHPLRQVTSPPRPTGLTPVLPPGE